VEWPRFDNFILLVIMLNTITMGLVDYSCVDDITGDVSSKCSWRNLLVTVCDPVFTFVFTAECAIKVLAMSFFSGRDGYLKDSWNRFDFLIVLASWVHLLFEAAGAHNLKLLRILRTLRPLRTVNKFPRLKLMVTWLFGSLASLLNGNFRRARFFFSSFLLPTLLLPYHHPPTLGHPSSHLTPSLTHPSSHLTPSLTHPRLIPNLLFQKKRLSLHTVMLLLSGVILMFSILGVQLWGFNGRMHGRCRLTPFPVRLHPSIVALDSYPIGSGLMFIDVHCCRQRVKRHQPTHHLALLLVLSS
jgi:hypothetical protein